MTVSNCSALCLFYGLLPIGKGVWGAVAVPSIIQKKLGEKGRKRRTNPSPLHKGGGRGTVKTVSRIRIRPDPYLLSLPDPDPDL
jgi:hypothetical protein